MPAYVLVRSLVTDREQYQKYATASTPITQKFGGRFLARGGKTEALEGPEEARRVVILEFPDMDAVRRWYHSPEYQAVRELRVAAGVAEFLAVDGL